MFFKDNSQWQELIGVFTIDSELEPQEVGVSSKAWTRGQQEVSSKSKSLSTSEAMKQVYFLLPCPVLAYICVALNLIPKLLSFVLTISFSHTTSVS
jgi:hypothetical protein